MPWARTAWLLADAAALGAPALVLLGREDPAAALAAVLVGLVAGHAAGVHRRRLVLAVGDQLPGLAVAALAAGGAAGLLARAPGPGALLATQLALLAFATGVALRTVIDAAARGLRTLGPGTRDTLVVGTGPVGRLLAEQLLLRPDLGLRPVGMVDRGLVELRDLPLPVVADVPDLEAAVRERDASVVVVAFPVTPDDALTEVLRRCLDQGREVWVVPRLHALPSELPSGTPGRGDVVAGVPLVRLSSPRRPTTLRRRAERLLEAAVAAAALLVLAPVLLLLAALVAAETRATPLVRRADGHGALAFRTLRPAVLGADVTAWRLEADLRSGPVGRVLRRTGLAELPGLVDVALAGGSGTTGAPSAGGYRRAETSRR